MAIRIGRIALACALVASAARAESDASLRLVSSARGSTLSLTVEGPRAARGRYRSEIELQVSGAERASRGSLEATASGATFEDAAGAAIVALAILEGRARLAGGVEPVSGLAFEVERLHAPLQRADFSLQILGAIGQAYGPRAQAVAARFARGLGLPLPEVGAALALSAGVDATGQLALTVTNPTTGAREAGAVVSLARLQPAPGAATGGEIVASLPPGGVETAPPGSVPPGGGGLLWSSYATGVTQAGGVVSLPPPPAKGPVVAMASRGTLSTCLVIEGAECASDLDCAVTRHCNVQGSPATCVECLTTADCASGQCIGNACIVPNPCSTNADCGDPLPICAAGLDIFARAVCVQCTADSDCAKGLICDNVNTSIIAGLDNRTFTCYLGTHACLGNSDCTSGAPICAPLIDSCVQCLSPLDCASTVCDGFTCAPTCTTNADCPTSAPNCLQTFFGGYACSP